MCSGVLRDTWESTAPSLRHWRQKRQSITGTEIPAGAKIENVRRDAGRDVTAAPQRDSDALRAKSMDTVREQPVNAGAPREQGRAILNASFLVAPPRVVDFQRALTAMVTKYEPSGFKFDFTGPWPPYHFVGEKSE